jgi:hypothetical protein
MENNVLTYTVTGHSNNGTGQALQEVAEYRGQFGTEQEAKWFVQSLQLYGTRKNVVFDISVKAVA